jgi:hypothetical protein
MPQRCHHRQSPAPASREAAAHRQRQASRGRWRYQAALATIAAAVVVLVVGFAGPALAQTADPALEQVIGRLRAVLVGLLVGLATLFLTVGGLRYLFAGVGSRAGREGQGHPAVGGDRLWAGRVGAGAGAAAALCRGRLTRWATTSSARWRPGTCSWSGY